MSAMVKKPISISSLGVTPVSAGVAHTVYGPSGYDAWSVCTAMVDATSHKIRTSSVFSIEGTVAHSLLARCFDLGQSPRELIGQKIYVEDDDAVGYWEVTHEMAEEVDKAYEYILDHIPPDAIIFIEQKFDLSKTLPGQKGTGDVVVFSKDYTKMWVFDFKYGKGVQVFAKDNNQMKLYGLGAIDNNLPIELRGNLKEISLHIVQPRIDHMEWWDTTRAELEQFRLIARSRFDEANDPDRRKFVPGEKQCKFCPIRSTCRYLAASQLKLVFSDDELSEMPEYRDQAEMTPEEQAALWPHLDFIAAWANNMKLYMDQQARKGLAYPDLKTVAGKRGFREWKDWNAAMVDLVFEYGVDETELYKKYPQSPYAIEKIIGRKRMKKEFKDLYSQKEGAPTLARLDDPRQTVTQALESEFDDVFEVENDDKFDEFDDLMF